MNTIIIHTIIHNLYLNEKLHSYSVCKSFTLVKDALNYITKERKSFVQPGHFQSAKKEIETSLPGLWQESYEIVSNELR